MTHIGVLSPSTGGFYFGEVLAGIVRELATVDGRVTLIQTLDAGQTGDEFVPAPDLAVPIGWAHLDGFIAIAQATGAPYLQRLRDAGKPVVLTSNDLPTVDAATVVADNGTGVRTAVAHLVEHGHTRIGFVGNLAQTDMRERYDAYAGSMADHGLAVTSETFFTTADHVESGGTGVATAVAAAVRDPRQPLTAVVTSTDRIAIGLMEGLGREGLVVPHDVAVVGFDDVEAGWHTTPPLASVDQQILEIGVCAARLLLAEMRGEQVPHVRHRVSSTFLPRGSCGCDGDSPDVAVPGAQDAELLVDAIGVHLGLDLRDETSVPTRGADLDQHDLDALDLALRAGLEAFRSPPPSPERLERFIETVTRLLTRAATRLDAAGLPGADLLHHSLVRVNVLLSHLQGVADLERTTRLSVSLVEQYDVGMGLLGRVGTDPSDLHWLGDVSVRLGCLALWSGTPGDSPLRVAGVYDPDGAVAGQVPASCAVEEFPPRAVMDRADPARNEVTFVLPVKGSSGDHGLLCLIGPVDTQSGSGRATYNHWAALLGVALKQQGLVEEIRRSEERYGLATAATHDGLWDWDVESGECFFSERCQELLGIDQAMGKDDREDRAARTTTPELGPWADAVHPDDVADLQRELRRAVEEQEPVEIEHRIAAVPGEYRWALCRAQPVGEPGQQARRVVGSLSDIHQRKELEQQLRHGALYDAVTGLPNRRYFLERLTRAVTESQHREDARFAVVFLDLDGFKLINDSLGHLMGDQLLVAIGERLRADVRAVDTASRFGGDEFAILLHELPRQELLRVVARIQETIAAPVRLGEHEVAVTASVGITTSDLGYRDAEDVLRDADIAMYHAKGVERGTASLFDPAMHDRATGRLQARSDLRTALLHDQFVLHYQPMVALDGAGLTRLEALVRWQHPDRGLLLPADFLPVMVETGTIVTLGEWIIDEVCAQIARWRADGDGEADVSVNLSHREFWSDRLLATVTDALARHRVPPSCLTLEITESVIMTDVDDAHRIMQDLHAAGVRLHIDDFGTGHSSLHALRAFPVDALKIDQSFIRRLGTDQQTTELVRIILAMGRTLGIDVVAEGVETEDQADRLRSMGCRTVQGWLYARALPGPEAGALLGTRMAARADVLAGER